MPSMTGRECVLAVMSSDQPDRVPFVEAGFDQKIVGELVGHDLPAVNPFDALSAEDDLQEMTLDVQLALNQAIGRDVLGFTMRPPVPARQAAGEDDLQFFYEGALKAWDDLDALVFPDLTSEAVRAPIRRFMERRGDYYTIMYTRVGVSATYLAMGMEHFMVTLYDDPRLAAEILRRFTDYGAGVVRLAAEAGFDAVWSADDMAGKHGVMWSPAMFREILWPHVRKFAEAVRETGIDWIFHSDGDLAEVLSDMVDFGITALNPIEPQCMDIREVRRAFPQLALLGNVDVDLLARGTPEEVRETVRGLIRDLGPSGRYAVASGNSVPRYVKLENVHAMVDAVQEYGQYPLTV